MTETLEMQRSVAAGSTDDSVLVSRIIAAYQKASAKFLGHGESMWKALNGMNMDIHEAAATGNLETLSDLLRNPHKTDLFYGFEYLGKSLQTPQTEEEKAGHNRALLKLLTDLCEVVGAIKSFSPEKKNPPERDLSIDNLLNQLDRVLGFRVDFPNPHPFQPGLVTDRGIISSRAVAALYQVWRIKTLTQHARQAKVLEIGAGLGRTAYYAYKAGIRDYTIIDLPMTNIAQANFLGRTIPQNDISVSSAEQGGAVKIRDVSWSPTPGERFDLIMNIDSLTEMDRGHAAAYLDMMEKHTDVFLSVNHEVNGFTVTELLEGRSSRMIIRNKYPLRPGYIEEIVLRSERI